MLTHYPQTNTLSEGPKAGPKGRKLVLEVGARRAPRLLVITIISNLPVTDPGSVENHSSVNDAGRIIDACEPGQTLPILREATR